MTLLVIKPTNDKLLATPIGAADAASRRLLDRWAHLHAVRMILGVTASAAFLIVLPP